MGATKSIWAERVRTWRESGQTAAEFARGKGYAPSTLSWYASRLRSERPHFVQLVPKAATAVDAALVVEVGGTRVRVTAGFDAKLLAQVVAALGGES